MQTGLVYVGLMRSRAVVLLSAHNLDCGTAPQVWSLRPVDLWFCKWVQERNRYPPGGRTRETTEACFGLKILADWTISVTRMSRSLTVVVKAGNKQKDETARRMATKAKGRPDVGRWCGSTR